MDELVRESLTETSERLDAVDAALVRFEQAPNNAMVLDSSFRVAHTIKGPSRFLRGPRQEISGLSVSLVQTAAAVSGATSLAPESAHADGSH